MIELGCLRHETDLCPEGERLSIGVLGLDGGGSKYTVKTESRSCWRLEGWIERSDCLVYAPRISRRDSNRSMSGLMPDWREMARSSSTGGHRVLTAIDAAAYGLGLGV